MVKISFCMVFNKFSFSHGVLLLVTLSELHGFWKLSTIFMLPNDVIFMSLLDIILPVYP